MASTLPDSVFNATLHRKLLALWFANLTRKALKPSEQNAAKWFGMGMSGDQKRSFDAQCRAVAGPALEHLSAANFKLPAWKSHAEDLQQAAALSLAFRKAIFSAATVDQHTEAQLEQPADAAAEAADAALEKTDVTLSMVLLLDQMSRNCFRPVTEQGQIYSHYDRMARALVHCVLGQATQDEYSIAGVDRVSWIRGNPPWRVWFLMPLMHSESLADHDLLVKTLEDVRQVATQNGNLDEAKQYLDSATMFEKKHRDILDKFGRYCHRNEALGRQSTQEEKDYLENGGDTFGTS